MKIDFTLELTQLMKFSGDTATAIRMYSKYSGGTPMNGGERRDPAMAPVDLMFLSDAITQLLNIGGAIERGDPVNIAETCHSVQRLFESYTTDNPSYSPQAKPTFDYWAGQVDLGVAVKALKGIKEKAAMTSDGEGHIARLKEIYVDVDPDTILSNTNTRIFLPAQHGGADYASMSLTDAEVEKVKVPGREKQPETPNS
ncbi:hypothetical protein Rfer_4441 (plasmid) [Rhodoferax ferrireducens T118]|uniref:Uncharacterized protein n=1 Tax=Albidiferax ferrireducens (strain ATCC BAA-621 / DSM 15236 / T118) TaxID=338969 RepID=Q21Q18_ALBFT|nr:hypothetical protein [Rhodoferax ferrireducens]ABD72127.1 hypothetical protein Rfer_4441 [Rhodoferax ferrireducens T118]